MNCFNLAGNLIILFLTLSPQATLFLEKFLFKEEDEEEKEEDNWPTITMRKCINLLQDCVRIAWTADVLPTSSHGELKISFRYDYQRIN